MIPRWLRFLWQRIWRGWDDSETWCIRSTGAEFILPRLKRYKEVSIVEWSRQNKEEGCDVIDELIWFLEVAIDDDDLFLSDNNARFKRASELWGKYYFALWW